MSVAQNGEADGRVDAVEGEGETAGTDGNNFGGQENLAGKKKTSNFGGQQVYAHQKTTPLPTKEIQEKRGWIEFPKKGTKNPRRYAYRRRWIKRNGRWVKSKPKRIKSIKPMSEEDYVKYKQRQERIKKAERRERRRANKGGR